MKETGIMMSGDHPRLILDGIKTQTRRVIKTQPHEEEYLEVGKYTPALVDKNGEMYPADYEIFGAYTSDGEYTWKCPYGQVGDRLWVRETWAIKDCGRNVKVDKETWSDGFPIERLQYIATDEPPVPDYWWNKRPSIFMPRWASRITLEITDIRVERVQEISPEDCLSEGIPPIMLPQILCSMDNATWYQRRFRDLWDSLNAKHKPTKYDREHGITESIIPSYAWVNNPWVWVISFKRIEV